MSLSKVKLQRIGIWSVEILTGDQEIIPEVASELEELGYSAIWYPGGAGGPVFEIADTVLSATNKVPVGLGILNLWAHQPGEVADGFAQLEAKFPGRYLLGIGASHKSMVDAGGQSGRFKQPWSAMNAYLDALDKSDPPVPSSRRVLAALGPKMMETARTRAAGIHSFFVTAEHTRLAREALGPDAILAPEHAVVLEKDPAKAREIARRYTGLYLRFPNYWRNLLRLGWTEDDIRDGGSDRLVDELVAWGDLDAIRKRIDAHHDAGADQVCVQVLTKAWGPPYNSIPRTEWRELADALTR
jgi:probable F420-dependent oxidoreductase